MMLFSFFISLFIFSNSHASSPAKEITIGVEKLDYLPYYGHKNNQYHGYARELFDQFGKDNSYRIHYKILPVARLFHDFITHQVDFKFPDNPNWKQTEKQKFNIQYSSAIAEFTDGILVTKKAAMQKDKKFSRIGTMRGFTPWILQEQIEQKKMRIIENNTLSGLLQQVSLGRIDGCFINIDVARYHIKNKHQPPDYLELNKNLPYDTGNYFLSTIKHKKGLNEFNLWLKENAAFHQQLKDKWGL